MLGRRVLPVRICTCPRRDLEQEEKNREKQLSKSSVLNVPPSPDPVVANGEKRKAFWILVILFDFFKNEPFFKFDTFFSIGLWARKFRHDENFG